MNGWERSLYRQLAHENARRLQIHNRAVSNWELNRDRCLELGLPVPKRPVPPALEFKDGKFWKLIVSAGMAHA